jgi:hypothetical protein
MEVKHLEKICSSVCGGHLISMNFPLRNWEGYYVYPPEGWEENYAYL